MTSVMRSRMMAGLVALTLLWPLVHLGLVASARIDPWELFGWAMYSKPAARLAVRVEVERDGALMPLRAMGEMRLRVKSFARDRTALGTFASPDELLSSIFASDKSVEAVVITLQEVQLDRESTYLVATDKTERFARP